MNARAKQRIDLQSQPAGLSRPKRSAISLAIACAAVGIFFTRPTAFGEVYSLEGSAMMLASAIAIFILLRGKLNFTFATTVPLLFAVLTIYMLIVDILKQSSNIDDAPKSAMISFAAIACLTLISTKKEYSRTFYDTLSFIILAFCTSILISFTLLCMGVPAQKLTLFHFNYTYRPPSGDILFPFTLRNNSGYTWIGFIPRLAGAFREVGLLPAFACWAAFYLAARRYSIIFSVICLTASAVCLSTLGVPLAVITSVAVIAQRSRLPAYIFTTVAPICGAILFAATWNIPYVGIGYKIKYVNDSFRDRINGMEGLFTTQDLLFGDGTSTDITGAINLPSMITRYGIVGFMLVLTIYAMALRNPKFFLGALTATVVTMMTTQPAGADPLVICLFMSWFALNERLPATAQAKLRNASTLRPHVRPAT